MTKLTTLQNKLTKLRTKKQEIENKIKEVQQEIEKQIEKLKEKVAKKQDDTKLSLTKLRELANNEECEDKADYYWSLVDHKRIEAKAKRNKTNIKVLEDLYSELHGGVVNHDDSEEYTDKVFELVETLLRQAGEAGNKEVEELTGMTIEEIEETIIDGEKGAYQWVDHSIAFDDLKLPEWFVDRVELSL